VARIDKKTLWLVTAAAAALVLLLQFCPATRPPTTLALQTSAGVLTIDLVDSPERRLFALGTLTRFPPGRGLWVVFEDVERPALWSKNLQVEADLLWLDETRQIVDRDLRVQPCAQTPCPDYTPERVAVSVLVLPPGTAEDATLAVGQTAFLRPPGTGG
jgi:uncharacterized membrane protein (UPF0127 family)